MGRDTTRCWIFTLLLLVGVSDAFGATTRQGARTVTLEVQNMTCFLCPLTIEKALNRVPGVIESDADFQSKTATVVFDPERTDVEALIRATTDVGYPSALRQ